MPVCYQTDRSTDHTGVIKLIVQQIIPVCYQTDRSTDHAGVLSN